MLLVALAICGIGFDMLHSVFNRFDTLDILLSTLEDGGELMVMSAIASFVFELTQTEAIFESLEKRLTEKAYDRR